MNRPLHRPTVGLTLGAGGSKGLSHIGVIKILQRHDIPIDFIAGSSIGALVGGLYAATKNIQAIEHIALTNNWPQIASAFFDPSLKLGFVKGDKLKRLFDTFLQKKTFNELLIPFAAVATDMTTGKPVVIRNGTVATAIRASISIPLLFKPELFDGKYLIDGGFSEPVPVNVVRSMGADIIIAVNLYGDYHGISAHSSSGLYTIVNRSVDLILHRFAETKIQSADIVINPKVGSYGVIDKFLTFKGSKEVIHLGEEEANQKIEDVKNIIRKTTRKHLIHKHPLTDAVRSMMRYIFHQEH